MRIIILLIKITVAQNEVAFSNDKLRGLYFCGSYFCGDYKNFRSVLCEDLVTERVTALGSTATDDEIFDVYTCVFQTQDKNKIKGLRWF